jgi:hypothetical protein
MIDLQTILINFVILIKILFFMDILELYTTTI